MEAFLGELAKQGPIAVMLVIMVLAYAKKDRDAAKREKELIAALTAEKDARIADSKAGNEVALRLQAQVIQAVQQISEIYRSLPALDRRGS